jgi:hypothetical protein
MATVLLTATPATPPTYNPSMADTFSWVPVEGAGRPLFARATYLANASDISVSLSAGNLNINLEDVEDLLKSQLGQSGFVFLTPGVTATGNFTTVQVVSTCKIATIAATNSTVGSLTAFELPQTFSFNGPITSITLQYGAAIVYKL